MQVIRVVAALAVLMVGCGAEGPDDSGPVSLTLEVENATREERVCQLTATVAGEYMTLVPALVLPPGGTRSGSVEVPRGTTADIVGGCWHPGSPEVGYRAIARLTTVPLTGPYVCRAIYTETDDAASVALPCFDE
jgi:hypothetical protein